MRSWNGTYGPTYAEANANAFWSFTTEIDFIEPTIYSVYLPLIFRAGQNPIQNGGFESGDVVWTEFSMNGWDLILNTTQDLPLSPHNGSWLAWLGGNENEISRISQIVTIPAGQSILHFWLFSASEDICYEDVFGVLIGDDVVYSQYVCDANDTYGWVHKAIDLTSYIGQKREIKFLAGLDGSLNSNVWVDDISLEATTSLNNSFNKNANLGRSDMEPTSLAGTEKFKPESVREISLLEANITDGYEQSLKINQEIWMLKCHLRPE